MEYYINPYFNRYRILCFFFNGYEKEEGRIIRKEKAEDKAK